MRAVVLLAPLALLALPTPALAQTFPLDDFSAHRFYVAPGPGNFVLVDGLELGRDLAPSFGATLGYAYRPFAADDLDCVTDQTEVGCGDDEIVETNLVSDLLTLQLTGAFTFLERIQVGLNLPIFLFMDGARYEFLEVTGDRMIAARTASFGGEAGGLGDPRISAKVRILDPDANGDGVTMGASAFLSLPLGHYQWDRRFLGDRLPTGGLAAIGGFRFDRFRLALNVGLTFREEQVNVRSAVGTELTWGIAGAVRVHELVEALVEANGATSFGQRFDSEAPTELRAAAVVLLGEVRLNAGLGAGLVYGVGIPVVHAFIGASYAAAPTRDSDGDSLMDDVDGCPTDAEDADGFADEDGCPELDNDEDGIADTEDGCADAAEDRDEWEDEDGCPDADDDGDGIADGYDSCARVAEDMDGDRDQDGCPDADRDGDGLNDDADQCADQAEDFDGFGDDDGCPEEDFDQDAVPDATDDCPEVAEDRDGVEDGDGCPEERAPRRRAR